ncbi:DNA repair exonuclease [Candidatus Pacearchaeota archaeon]|nr:DNA repair exonuclease [Candidatus Pacearchaeota archaeon]
MVKFAHLSDVHLGGWKFREMQELNFQSFQKALQISIDEKVDFILIAGDLFDTAYPPIEILKETFAEFKKIKESNIPCFIISGSHDYSVSGKTFLEVLEKSGFCKNVADFFEEGGKIKLRPTMFNRVALYGYPGKKSGLDVGDLRRVELIPSDGFKIFMLHTTIGKVVENLGNLPIETIDADSLPYADYYALGHIHVRFKYKNFVYPGPVFPNNFAELENLNCGSFCIFDSEKEEMAKIIELKIKEIESIKIEITDARLATEQVISEMEKRDLNGKIVLLRLSGELDDSKNSEIKFPQIDDFAKQKGAYFLLKNIHDLKTKEAEIDLEIEKSGGIEEETIKIYSEKNPSDLNKIIPSLISSLSMEKQEGETTETFSSRVFDESRKILNF